MTSWTLVSNGNIKKLQNVNWRKWKWPNNPGDLFFLTFSLILTETKKTISWLNKSVFVKLLPSVTLFSLLDLLFTANTHLPMYHGQDDFDLMDCGQKNIVEKTTPYMSRGWYSLQSWWLVEGGWSSQEASPSQGGPAFRFSPS